MATLGLRPVLSSGTALRSARPQLGSLFRSFDRMQEVFGPKKKPRDSPAPGLRHSRTHFPSDPVDSNDTSDCVQIRVKPRPSPATALTANSVSSGSLAWPEPLPPRPCSGCVGTGDQERGSPVPLFQQGKDDCGGLYGNGVARVVALARLTFMPSPIGDPQGDFLGTTDPRAGRQVEYPRLVSG
jgi:hypothetical protein